MAAGDPGVLKRNFSATAIQTSLVNTLASAGSGDTTTSVAVVSISGFPSTFPYTLIIDPDGSKEEVVTVTGGTSTSLTMTRGQDNTAAVSHAAASSVRHGVSGRDFKEEQTHQAARGYDNDTAILSSAGLTHIHGLAANDGNVVGSDQLVTLTRKTLTAPTINGATLTGTVSSTASIVVSGAGTITGLSSAGMSTSSATPKSYVDAILGSATAASTSATSAATSATSAATSASSAATSATSAATSATSAATSASSALTSQTAAATSASSASTSASSALTSQTAAATSATSAATSASSALTSQTAAATSATSASTSATSAAASATAAGTSATSAAASATAAATSATSAAASATAASTSVTSAGVSASAASTSAANAAVSASSAGTSASSAATSQTAAATSASSASTSASSAATSASDAATIYDNFDDRYLGAKASAPTLDNDGNALLTGALYFNSTLAAMYVWTGSAWSVMATSGDIESVTAGTGLTGGGASGAVTVSLDTTSAYVVPSQTSNSGKYLTTDGTTASWGAISGSLAQPTEPSSPTDGLIWVDTDGTAPTTVVTRWSKAPTAGTTTLSGTDDTTNTLAYTPGYEQVFLNGVLLSRGSDYTATTGTSVVLSVATITSDIVEIICPLQVAYTDAITTTAANAAYVPKTLTTTTGDTIYASAANTPARLGIGSTGNVLTVAGGVPTWAAPAGGGKVLQVVTANITTDTIISSTSYTDTSMTVTITPTSATSKILVLFALQCRLVTTANDTVGIGLKLLRGATTVVDMSQGTNSRAFAIQATADGIPTLASTIYTNYNYLDSPATTSATTYKVQAALNSTAASRSARFQMQDIPSVITVLEIGA